jgi:hypothetical protein
MNVNMVLVVVVVVVVIILSHQRNYQPNVMKV